MAVNPALLTMLMHQAPTVLAMLKNSFSGKQVSNLQNLLQNNYDPGIMEENAINVNNWLNNQSADSVANMAFEPIDFLENQYSTDVYGPGKLFPSDGNSQLDLKTLSERLLKDPNNAIGANGQPALMSAAVMHNNPQIIPAENLPELPNTQVIPGTDIVVTDADMDDIHSSEMWDNGYGYQHPLRDWYKKNKR